MQNKRICDTCHVCCDGHLTAEIYGTQMGPAKCTFHCGHCTIYQIRPQLCKNYQCLWSQGILPEEYRPDKIGLLVSVEKTDNGQFLRIIKTQEVIDINHLETITKFCTENNTPYIITERNKETQIHGPDTFIRFIQKKNKTEYW